MGKTVGFETLNPATFMVHTNQQVFAHAFDVAAQCGELGAVLPIAGEKDDAADQWVLEALAVFFGQGQTSNVNDERGVL